MKKIATMICITVSVVLGQGCATVTRGTSQDFGVTSEPSAASVKLTTGMTCETPCSLDLKRSKGFAGTVSKEGYKPAEFSVQSKIATAGGVGFAGNVVLGGVIGMGVDAASGAMKDLYPNKVHAVLAEENSKTESRIVILTPTEENAAEKQQN